MKELAKKFHDAYERLAPKFKYETRQETKVFNPRSSNGRLMIAVCEEIFGESKELENLVEKCNSPGFSISKPFPPVPGRGRWIVRASREYGMRNWKHFEASDNDLFQALRDLDEKMNKKKK